VNKADMATAELCRITSTSGHVRARTRHAVHELSTPPIDQKRDGTGHARPDIKNNSHDSGVKSAFPKNIIVNAGTT
jgi:hypothetical protein